MRGTRSLYVRMAAALGLLVAVHAGIAVAVVAGIGLLWGAWIPWWAVVAALGGAFAFEYVYLRTVEFGDPDPGDHPDRERLQATATRLAKQVGLAAPTVVVVESDHPDSLSVGGLRTGTVVVTSGLVDVLDDDEIEAVLAHELAHIHNRDALVVVLASFLPVFLRRLSVGMGLTESVSDRETPADAGRPGPSGDAVVAVCFGVMALGVVGAVLGVRETLGTALVAGAVGLVVLTRYGRNFLGGFAVLAVTTLARQRELAADRGGATITGDPASMASALDTLYSAHDDADEVELPIRGRRLHVLTIAPTPIDLLTTDVEGMPGVKAAAVAFDETWVGTVVDPDYHPTLEARLDQLAELLDETG